MQIEWQGKKAPDATSSTGQLVRAEGHSDKASLEDGFLAAASALGQDLASRGASPAHIEHLTISVPDMNAFLAALSDMDLLYREALGGNSGRVALTTSDGGIGLEAQAIVPPASDEIVFAGLTRAEVNREYSPRATVPEAPDILARWRREGAEFQKSRDAELLYGTSSAKGIDLFLPKIKRTQPPPLHVYIHGGYWQALDKRDNGQFGAALLDAGIAFAALNYPLCPPATVGQIVEDCRAALAQLYHQAAEHGYDGTRITISGHSAGGHLVAMLAATDWPSADNHLPADLIKGTVSISGLFDVEPLVHTGLNKALGLSIEQARDLSPIRQNLLSPGPVIAAVGGAESNEFRRQSRDYVTYLEDQGGDAAYLELPGLNHFTVVEALSDTGSDLYKNVVEMTLNR